MKCLLTVPSSVVNPGMGIDIDTITKNEIEILFKLHVTCIVQIKHVIGWLKHAPEESQKNDNCEQHLESLLQLKIY